MNKPAAAAQRAVFDLASVQDEMRQEDAYARDGHTARTLVREPDLRIVLIAMRAGSRIAEHRANETVSIHALTGHVRVGMPDRAADVPAGSLLVLDPGMRHEVEAATDSAFILTLGWRG